MRILYRCALLCTLWALVHVFVGVAHGNFRVSGSSMEQTIHNGSRVITCPGLFPVDRFDVVLLEEGGEILLKRVVAFQGDLVTWTETGVRVNGTLVLGDSASFEDLPIINAAYIGSDQVFVVGDNLRVSIDSREFGAVPLEAVIGEIIICDGRFFSPQEALALER